MWGSDSEFAIAVCDGIYGATRFPALYRLLQSGSFEFYWVGTSSTTLVCVVSGEWTRAKRLAGDVSGARDYVIDNLKPLTPNAVNQTLCDLIRPCDGCANCLPPVQANGLRWL